MTANTSTPSPVVRVEAGTPPKPSRARLGPVAGGSSRVVTAGLLGGIATASGVALTATSGWLIARAAERPIILTLMTAIVAVRAFGIARPVFRYWERVVSHDAALATLADRRTSVYEALIPLTPARLGRRRRSDVLTAVVHDISDEVDAQVRVTVPVISSAVAGVVAIGFTTAISPSIGLVIGLLAAVVALVSVLSLRLESRNLPALLAARGEVVRVSELVTSQADELRAIGGWSTATRWLDEAHASLARATRTTARGRAFASGLHLVLVAAATIVVSSVVTGLDVSSPIKALLVLTPVALADAITPLADAMRALAHARAAAQRTEVLLVQQPAVVDRATADVAEAPEEFDGLALREIVATWGDPDTGGLLGPFDLDLGPGRSIAVVGPNGSGKSTLLAVLARHLDPVSGEYVARAPHGDENVLAEPLDQARARIAVVDDEPHVFATTLRGNLSLARPDASDEDMVQSLARAGLGDFVRDLPDGLDTRLGAEGRGLSGGERARLAIARAHLSTRPVLALDEPVAHLDPPTARSVLTDLLATPQDESGRSRPSVVLVTHRPEGLDLVDHVFTVSQPHR